MKEPEKSGSVGAVLPEMKEFFTTTVPPLLKTPPPAVPALLRVMVSLVRLALTFGSMNRPPPRLVAVFPVRVSLMMLKVPPCEREALPVRYAPAPSAAWLPEKRLSMTSARPLSSWKKRAGPEFARAGGVSYSWRTELKRGFPVLRQSPMQPLWSNVAVLAVTAIFYVWRAHSQVSLRRDRRLRERVAYMLWVAATGRVAPCRQLVEVD